MLVAAGGHLLRSIEPFFSPAVSCVRFRYHSAKVERGPALRRYGYKDDIIQTGLLPRLKTDRRLPLPEYNPKNVWSRKRATFGQNDYIDILGNGELHPAKLLYDVPPWLRGFKGNEFQRVLRRLKLQGEYLRQEQPTVYRHTVKRANFLFKWLNKLGRTKDFFHKSK